VESPASRMIPVSIIVPARNEEKHIAACLGSLVAQDYRGICEILVFDGGSTDQTRRIVAEIATKEPLLHVFDNPKVQQAAAMNLGIRMAKGEIIVRADAHALYEPDYVSQCVYHLQTTRAANVGGPMRPVIGNSLPGKAIAFCYLSRFGIGVARFHNSNAQGFVDTVWLGAFRKSVYDHVGLYNEEVPRIDDLLFNYRLRTAGYRIFLTAKIRSSYFPANTIGGFLTKAFRNGFAFGRVLFVIPKALRPRHLAPFTFVSGLVVLCVLSIALHWARWLLGGLLALHLSLGAAFAIPGARLHGLAFVAVMPPLFMALHVAYGFGTIWGIFRSLIEKLGRRS